MFGKKRKYKKGINAVGPHIHKQVRSALQDGITDFTSPAHLAFTAGYLIGFVWETLDDLKCNDPKVQIAMLSHLCEGIIPGRMAELVHRGDELGNMEGDAPQLAETRRIYEEGMSCGTNDSMEYRWNKSSPENLLRFLSGKEIVLMSDAD